MDIDTTDLLHTMVDKVESSVADLIELRRQIKAKMIVDLGVIETLVEMDLLLFRKLGGPEEDYTTRQLSSWAAIRNIAANLRRVILSIPD